MKTLIKEHHFGTSFLSIYCGWGNGYVLIPKGHPAWGKHYDDIDVDVHEGLTFAQDVTPKLMEHFSGLSDEDMGMWCVGFDTAHYGDNIENWPKRMVEAETEYLKNQLMNYE